MVSSFKRQQFQCGEPWVKEALVLLNCKLAWAVKTFVLSHHKLPLANACSKIDQVCPDNMVNINFYLRILPL